MCSWNGTDGNTAKGDTGKEQYSGKDSCIYIARKFQCRKTSWNVQNDDEHYGEDSRKSSGEESRSNSGRRGYAGYDAAWWRTCQDTEPAGRD